MIAFRKCIALLADVGLCAATVSSGGMDGVFLSLLG